jgi:Family of unknown function (DUF6491)
MFSKTKAIALLIGIPMALPMANAQVANPKTICFDSHRVRQWISVNDETLLIDTGRKKYRITFLSSCANLGMSSSLVFNGDPISGRVCSSTLNYVNARGETCKIRDISEIDREAFKAENSKKHVSVSVKRAALHDPANEAPVKDAL